MYGDEVDTDCRRVNEEEFRCIDIEGQAGTSLSDGWSERTWGLKNWEPVRRSSHFRSYGTMKVPLNCIACLPKTLSLWK